MEGHANAPVITAMDKSVVHKICSGQVILDLSAAVKELVENSLDAGASNIEISLKEHGEDCFKVIDNGCGISPDNFQVLARKYHTSKIKKFSDLYCLTTFGFRGEALSSLCSLGSLTIETRTKNEEVGTHLTFDHSGSVIAERKTARQVGTTVSVEKLFSMLPVRSKEFSRNVRRDYGKLITLLNAYAIMAKGVRFLCTNITSKNSKSVVLKTQGNNSVKENIIAVLGLNTFQCLEPLSINVSACCTVEGFLSKPGYGCGRNMGDRQFFYINGRPVDMPKVRKLLNEVYKCSNSKQYPIAIMNFIMPTASYDVNVTPDKRKVFMTDEGSLILSLRAEIEKVYSPHQCSYSINNMKNSSKEADTALQDDMEVEDSQGPSVVKSFSPKYDGQIVTSTEQEIDNVSAKDFKISNKDIDLGTEYDIDDFTSPGMAFSKKVDEGRMVLNNCSRLKQSKYIKLNTTVTDKVPSSSVKKDTYCYSNMVQPCLQRFLPVYKRKHDNSCNMLSEMPLLRDESNSRQIRKIGTENISVSKINSTDLKDEVAEADKSDHHHEAYNASNKVKTFCSSQLKICDRDSKKDNSEEHDSDFYISEAVPETVPEKNMDTESGPPTLSPSPKACDKNSNMITCSDQQIYPLLQFSIYNLKKRRDKRASCLLKGNSEAKGRNRSRYSAATLANSHLGNDEAKTESLTAATIELERFFRKEDFGRMEVIGQFNLGFIIGKLDQDLFMVDQHAADEKYNYERISKSTILGQQPLLKPMQLELSPEEEVVASMNMDIIRKNGFLLIEDMHAPPRQRLLLKAVPFSKNITFGVEDLKELISTLADSEEECSIISSYKMDTADSICPSRVRAMFASRACRMSVMIGDPLQKSEMQKILENLVDLKSPWNCPHGRPTMRHLADLTTLYKRRFEVS